MDEKIGLPSGGWAVLRDPLTVTAKQRRSITDRAAQAASDGRERTVAENYEWSDLVVRLMVSSWSHGAPPRDALGELEDLEIPGVDLDFLRTEVMKEGRLPWLAQKVDQDPKAPGGNSGALRPESPSATLTLSQSQPSPSVGINGSSSESPSLNRDSQETMALHMA